MKNQTIMIAMCSLLGACALEDEELATDDNAITANNALSNNALANNALTNNALANNALANNALANNGLVSAAAVKNELCNTNATPRDLSRSLFSYLVSCALPAGTSITVSCTNGTGNATYAGSLGLAPNWASAAPSQADKEVVSSCIAARVNTKTNIIHLSLRGASPSLATTSAEKSSYPYLEGAFYGNLFQASPAVFACGASHAGTQVGRGCAWGTCSPLQGLGGCGPLCTTLSTVGGYFQSCTDPSGRTWTRPVSVYLQDYQPLLAG